MPFSGPSCSQSLESLWSFSIISLELIDIQLEKRFAEYTVEEALQFLPNYANIIVIQIN